MVDVKDIPDSLPTDEYLKVVSSFKTDLKLLSPIEIVEKIKNGDKDFSNVRIVGIDWARRDLSGYNFSGSKLEWNMFNSCKLDGSNFSEAFIDACDFSDATLKNANFVKAQIWSAGFVGSIVEDADFSNSYIRNGIFINCNTQTANFLNATKIRMMTSWDEITDEDWETVLKYLGYFNFPNSVIMQIRSRLGALKTKSEKLKLFYGDIRNLVNPQGNLYNYPKLDTVAGVGRYVDKEKGGKYTESRGYKASRDEDAKGVRYKK